MCFWCFGVLLTFYTCHPQCVLIIFRELHSSPASPEGEEGLHAQRVSDLWLTLAAASVTLTWIRQHSIHFSLLVCWLPCTHGFFVVLTLLEALEFLSSFIFCFLVTSLYFSWGGPFHSPFSLHYWWISGCSFVSWDPPVLRHRVGTETLTESITSYLVDFTGVQFS